MDLPTTGTISSPGYLLNASFWRSFGHVQLGAEFADPEFYRRDYISHHIWWELGNIARGKKTKTLTGRFYLTDYCDFNYQYK